MRLAISILGTEVFALDLNRREQPANDNGDRTSYPLGFTASHGDARWEPGVDLEP